MLYREDRHGERISILGYGCMRFSRKGAGIDLVKAEGEIMRAIEAGVNYFDTAYIYPGSEALLGEILEKNNVRDQVKVATKLPPYMVSNHAAIDRIFNEQLARLRTDRVDYYLMHMITDISQWQKLQKLGIEEWIAQKKATGQIRNIGFSFHGNTAQFLPVLEAYDWDFCQIQYNYVDEHSQAGRKGLEGAVQKGIPVIIMEPLRGGKLVDRLPNKAKQIIAQNPLGYSAAEYALRWLWNQPEVTCVLSGMNSLDMVEENCRIASASEPGSLRPEAQQVIDQIKACFAETERVGCTGCSYCMPCPKGVDIPSAFKYYNQMYAESKHGARIEYMQMVAFRKEPAFATQCVGCGACERHCPQSIPIREKLKEADAALRPVPYKIGISIARKFMLRS